MHQLFLWMKRGKAFLGEYAFALSQIKMRVLSKGMVLFHLKLKVPWKYIFYSNKNTKVLQVCLNCTRTILSSSAMNATRIVAKRKLEKIYLLKVCTGDECK